MLRAGIIGCGGITERRHGPVLVAHDGVELVALADVNQQRLQLLGDRHLVPEAARYTDYEKMLAHAELDIVHVCTPHDLHEAPAIAAMEAGGLPGLTSRGQRRGAGMLRTFDGLDPRMARGPLGATVAGHRR
ncbi:MAG: Gfo/Idh/MocA family oxidoreductase [bacterium]|nr:Gfo/Idh/MocA family oxidoreductase [bacterium]